MAIAMRFQPLLRFFYRARLTKSRAFIGGVFILLMGYLSFFTDRFDDPERRLWVYWPVMVLLLQLWLPDDGPGLAGGVRLFAIPRQNMRPVILAWLAARNLLAISVGLAAVIILYNVDIFSSDSVAMTTVITLGICVFLANLSSFVGMFVRGKAHLAAMWALMLLIVFFIARAGDVMRPLLSALLLPFESITLGVKSTIEPLDENMLALAYPFVTSALVWCTLSFLAFHRRFR